MEEKNIITVREVIENYKLENYCDSQIYDDPSSQEIEVDLANGKCFKISYEDILKNKSVAACFNSEREI
jgi:hypothetical protein